MNQFLANTWYSISQPDSEKVKCNQVLLNYFTILFKSTSKRIFILDYKIFNLDL